MSARFAFRSAEFSVEFRGTEEYVTEQVDLVAARIREVLGAPAGPSAAAAPAVEPARKQAPLEEFYARSKTRAGRGALQDSIILFAHYVQFEQGKAEFSIEDLNFCFDLLNIPRPKSLANTLGILKRDRGWLVKGSRRGAYTLTTRGRERVSGLVG
jgi:hypothetical protein